MVHREGNRFANLLSTAREDVFISVITEAELRTGQRKTLHLIESFVRPLAVLDFTSEDAKVYAAVRVKLERAGTPIEALRWTPSLPRRRSPHAS